VDLLRIHPRDNVAVAVKAIDSGRTLAAGELLAVVARQPVPAGHKLALVPIRAGEEVIKYGYPIGTARADIAAGDWVHTHNCKTNLGALLEYTYRPVPARIEDAGREESFLGYRRPDGRVGTRNEIWIIPTVGCVNQNARLIAEEAGKLVKEERVDGVFAFPHPYGCSQLGEDMINTQKILANLVRHPNAGGVLVLGLGCENNNIKTFREFIGPVDSRRVKFLEAQTVEDEIAAGVRLVAELAAYAGNFRRTSCPLDDLTVGLKCGGSDGFSGITANPLVGLFSDRLVAGGGTTVLTEVPEMFGAETILMNRARNKAVFEKIVRMVNGFKTYFTAHDQPVYENPSPGNKDGGITTLEDKSLGCIQKGGYAAPVADVLQYGDTVSVRGLNLLNGPGNDLVAATVLAAAGCQVILFTTGRGTPLGTVVPTVKIATNSDIFRRKRAWLDFDAGRLLDGISREELADEFFAAVLNVASGRTTKSERLGFRDLTLFKSGVTV
jgi:Altronate dehydratase